jgi:hypothetical protein
MELEDLSPCSENPIIGPVLIRRSSLCLRALIFKITVELGYNVTEGTE